MTGLNFKEWIISESLNPKVLLPYINHKKDQRLSRSHKGYISDARLKMDYEQGMDRLRELFEKESSLPVLMRKSMRQYEITRDRMHDKARHDQTYMIAYQDAEPDNDLWMFCRALEDISGGNAPNLEKML